MRLSPLPRRPLVAPVEVEVTAVLDMPDAIRVNASNLRGWTGPVAGYGTGTGPVPWDQATWDLFPGPHCIIDQSPSGALFAAGHAHLYDVEPLAGTPQQVPAVVRQRVNEGIQWSPIYGTDSTLAQVYAALAASGTWFYGHVSCFLADWNLSRDQAAALIGTQIHGMTCTGVQWASPTSNPSTPVPGFGKTLAEVQCDLSVIDAHWLTPAAAPHLVKVTATATFSDGSSRSWTVP